MSSLKVKEGTIRTLTLYSKLILVYPPSRYICTATDAVCWDKKNSPVAARARKQNTEPLTQSGEQ